MRFKYNIKVITLIVVLSFSILLSCNKKDDSDEQVSDFLISSPEIGTDSLIQADYTCDGVSATLPLEWSGEPEGTASSLYSAPIAMPIVENTDFLFK